MIPISSIPECVFVVDTDPDLRNAVRRLLYAAGRNSETFSSAFQFMNRLPYHRPGCVVLDLQMPDLSGEELWDIMCNKGVELPVVFLTGDGDVRGSVEAMKKGAVDVLVKPVDDAALLRAVDEALSRHAANHARQLQRREILNRLYRLSSREYEVLEHVLCGHQNKQIAVDLAISIRTVKAHRGHMMEKMECRSVAALIFDCALAGIQANCFGPGALSKEEARGGGVASNYRRESGPLDGRTNSSFFQQEV